MAKAIFKRFLKRKISVIGAVVLLLFIFMALVGPFLCRQDPLEQDLLNVYAPASAEHILGTDNLGRDVFTRLVYGSRVTLAISFAGVFLGAIIGITLGVLAGFYGGRLDALISRAVDLLLAFPGLLLAIVVVAILGTGNINTVLAIAVYTIPVITRMVRSIVMVLKQSEYVQACYIMGVKKSRIILTHLIPNTMSQIIVNVTLSLGTAILTASSLSFLGLGVTPPSPEWGAMLAQARIAMRETPFAALAPGIAITLVVLSFSMLGDGLRDALDPKLKNK